MCHILITTLCLIYKTRRFNEKMAFPKTFSTIDKILICNWGLDWVALSEKSEETYLFSVHERVIDLNILNIEIEREQNIIGFYN